MCLRQYMAVWANIFAIFFRTLRWVRFFNLDMVKKL